MTSAAESVVERLLGGSLSVVDLLSVALGDRLGLYRCLAVAEEGGAPAAALSSAAGVAERYVTEWLAQQVATGLVETVGGGQGAPRFRLAPGVAEVTTDRDSLLFLAPLARRLAGGGPPPARAPEVDLDRSAYLQLLPELVGAMPDVQARLQGDAPTQAADVGCGEGWSAIGLARACPRTTVDACDAEPAAVELARRHVADHGLAGRVRVHHGDVRALPAAAPYDLVTAFGGLPDLPFPVRALGALRRLASPGGAVLVGDVRGADQPRPPGDVVERRVPGFSLLGGVPDSVGTPGPSAGGTTTRTRTLRRYAALAGFAEVTVLPVEHDRWRFSRLHLPPEDRG